MGPTDHALRDARRFIGGLAEDEGFSGAVLVARRHETVMADAHGLADRERGHPNTVETHFRLGSMSKMFTGVSVLRLVQDGRVDLAAPLRDYLPSYPNSALAERVRIRHLLTHTGGTGDFFGETYQQHRSELHELSDYARLFGDRPTLFEPGSDVAYSNYGMILLGLVIEAVSGQSYYDFVRDHVYAPAGMDNSGSPRLDEHPPNTATGYTRMIDRDRWVANTGLLAPRGTSAGGGISTVDDLKRFANAVMEHRLLSPAMTERLLQGQVERPKGKGGRYACGFVDHRDGAGAGWVGHSGGAPGMEGHLRFYPSSGHIVAVLANRDPPLGQRVIEHEHIDRALSG